MSPLVENFVPTESQTSQCTGGETILGDPPSLVPGGA